MPTGVEFAHNFPVRHAWMGHVLRRILACLRLPAQHVRSAGPLKGGRGNPKSFGSPRVDELPREFALGRNSGPLRLPIGIDVPPNTRIALTNSGEICAVRDTLGAMTLDGFPIDGNKAIGLDPDGRVNSFTLGADTELGGWPLAAGTTFSTWPKILNRRPTWHCTLRSALRLPELRADPKTGHDCRVSS